MQYIILLRGVNVGGRIIKMAELKSCFEKAGYKNVSTLLQTGNVILETNKRETGKLRMEVESLLCDTFSYPAKVLVITPGQLQEVIRACPFVHANADYHRYVVFTEEGFEKILVKQCGDLNNDVEKVLPGKDVVYWRVLKGNTLDSTFGKYMGKVAAKQFLTNRNLNTLEKILAKCS